MTNELQILLKELKHNMGHSIVNFSYKKKDGTIRNAQGTLCECIILERGGEMPKGTGEAPSDTFPYWDVEVGSWRCFKSAFLIDANIDEVKILDIKFEEYE